MQRTAFTLTVKTSKMVVEDGHPVIKELEHVVNVFQEVKEISNDDALKLLKRKGVDCKNEVVTSVKCSDGVKYTLSDEDFMKYATAEKQDQAKAEKEEV